MASCIKMTAILCESTTFILWQLGKIHRAASLIWQTSVVNQFSLMPVKSWFSKQTSICCFLLHCHQLKAIQLHQKRQIVNYLCSFCDSGKAFKREDGNNSYNMVRLFNWKDRNPVQLSKESWTNWFVQTQPNTPNVCSWNKCQLNKSKQYMLL